MLFGWGLVTLKMRFNKYITTTILICFLLCFIWTLPTFGEDARSLDIYAEGAVLMDAESGRVLWAKNPHKRLYPASTTKILTAVLAIEKGKLDSTVVVSREAAETEGSAIWLKEGERLTLEDLLYAVLLSSANDAAEAVAEHIGGTQENFVRMMNEKAKAIGARDSHFENPHGLHEESHYTTAYDLALIARYAMTNSTFEKIVATEKKIIPWEGHDWSRLLINKNNLIRNPKLFPGADGIKNGYTKAAGNCLVASATRNGMRLIAVVLNAPNATGEVIKLLDYGFKNFSKEKLVNKGEILGSFKVEGYGRVNLVASKTMGAALREGEKNRIKAVVYAPKKIDHSVRKGDIMGKIKFTVDGETIAVVDLVAAETVKNPWLSGLLKVFLDVFSFWA
ncbi:MAG TPA: D-alanyl-D-alanine carboxypeptidase [Peptococcaceae bacterium]|nr:MAG: Serine-type D-Ala-D-Ala carboxypeptidase [Clostridia bacterium 41_269]HBT20494.1 D-alanyl-D-alanine carboxypeptidase [Peptococcaceae bacterium]